jgi:lysine biosynthesis protein LysW
MPTEQLASAVQGRCPVCAAFISLPSSVEETEVLPCTECQTMLVIDRCDGSQMILSEAPQIEEDWGE